MNWDDLPDAAQSNAQSWDDLPDAAPAGKQTSTAEALGSGALQGLSLGFADEAIGAVKGALDPNKTVKEGIEEQRKRKEIIEAEHPIASTVGDVAGSVIPAAVSIAGTVASGGAAAPTIAPTAGKAAAGIGKLFAGIGLKKAAKEGAKAAIKEGGEAAAKKAATEGLEAVAKSATTGAEKTAATIAKEAAKKVPGKTMEAALTGAAAGVGYSDAIASDDPEAAMRALASAGMGAGLGVAANKILPAAGKAIKGLKGKLGRQLISGVTEVDEEAVRYILDPAKRAQMATTKTMPVIGEEFVKIADDKIWKIRAMSGQSFDILKNVPAKESAFQLKEIFTKNADELAKKNKLGTYDDAIADLMQRGERLEKSYILPSGEAAKAIPLDDVKSIIWELDDMIQYDTRNLSPAEKIKNEAYKKVRGELNERIRTASPEYALLMDKISKETQDIKTFRDAFKSNPETIGRQISEYMKLERLGRDKTKKIAALDIIADTPEGAAFMEEAKAVWARDQFNKSVGKGSTNTNVGIMLGGSVIGSALMAGGLPPPVAIAIGGAIGGVFGKIWNSYGTRMTRYMLETYIERSAGKDTAVPHIVKKPLAEFTRAMMAIPEPMQRMAVVNALLQHESMKNSEMKAPNERSIKYGFDRVAR